MSDLSKVKKRELSKVWKEAQCKDYLLTEENVQALFEYLEEQLDITGCDHTLHHTERWLNKYDLSNRKIPRQTFKNLSGLIFVFCISNFA